MWDGKCGWLETIYHKKFRNETLIKALILYILTHILTSRDVSIPIFESKKLAQDVQQLQAADHDNWKSDPCPWSLVGTPRTTRGFREGREGWGWSVSSWGLWMIDIRRWNKKVKLCEYIHTVYITYRYISMCFCI